MPQWKELRRQCKQWSDEHLLAQVYKGREGFTHPKAYDIICAEAASRGLVSDSGIKTTQSGPPDTQPQDVVVDHGVGPRHKSLRFKSLSWRMWMVLYGAVATVVLVAAYDWLLLPRLKIQAAHQYSTTVNYVYHGGAASRVTYVWDVVGRCAMEMNVIAAPLAIHRFDGPEAELSLLLAVANRGRTSATDVRIPLRGDAFHGVLLEASSHHGVELLPPFETVAGVARRTLAMSHVPAGEAVVMRLAFTSGAPSDLEALQLGVGRVSARERMFRPARVQRAPATDLIFQAMADEGYQSSTELTLSHLGLSRLEEVTPAELERLAGDSAVFGPPGFDVPEWPACRGIRQRGLSMSGVTINWPDENEMETWTFSRDREAVEEGVDEMRVRTFESRRPPPDGR